MMDSAHLAKGLINTPHYPQGYKFHQQLGLEARAYHKLIPYPFFAFSDWKSEVRGPLPKCMPFVKSALIRGVDWLFGKPPEIMVADDESLEKTINEAWGYNWMAVKMRKAARLGATDGGVALKFAYDGGDEERPLKFMVLSLLDHCCFYTNPLDGDETLMVRVQFPYHDPRENRFYWFREEWTAEEHVQYEPLEVDRLINSQINGMASIAFGVKDPDDGFQIKQRIANEFGVIPIIRIVNRESDNENGEGDFWDCFRIVDRVNLAVHLMDKSNQLDAEANLVLIDAEIEQDDMDRGPAPGEPMVLDSKDDKHQAKADLLERSGQFRPHLETYATELKRDILEAVGSVYIRGEDITNKGNMTVAVLTQLYEPQVRSTSNKREQYGQFGIKTLLETACLGLSNMGVKGFAPREVSLRWPAFFDYTPEEKQVITSTTLQQRDAQLMPHERAVEKIATAENVRDINAYKDEVGDYIKPLEDKGTQ